MSLERLAGVLPEIAAREMLRRKETLSEIRIRSGNMLQLVSPEEDAFFGPAIDGRLFQKILMCLMEHSYYAREDELAQGFFTMRDGCRVGVSGSYVSNGSGWEMRAIGSMCIRIAREVPGCGTELVARMSEGGKLRSALLVSRPGMGKTTMLRDAARLLSDGGVAVGIADERHEIAACRDGVPTLSVGIRTDVADGCPKCLTMEQLIRTMAPKVIVTDEIGGKRDAEAVREAMRRGVAVLASVHGESLAGASAGIAGKMMGEGLFSLAVLLDGKPGRIAEVRELDGAGRWS